MIRISLGIFSILSIGICYEQVIRYKVHSKYEANGLMVNIGDKSLHAVISGKESAYPTVVFEAGYYPTGASSLIWRNIQEEISKYTKTISYDRSGNLWSEGKEEPTIDKSIENLYKLLKKIDGEGPYVLVGHSISGLSVRAFTTKYPSMVRGLILIDASHPDQEKKIPKELYGNQKLPNLYWSSFLGMTGYLRNTNNYQYSGTKQTDSINIISNALFPEKINSIIKGKALKSKWIEKAQEKNNFGDLPIKIIAASGEKMISQFESRKQGEQFNTIWEELQKDMLSLSTKSELVFAKDSGHYIPLEQPDLITTTILKLLDELEQTE